MMRKWIIYLSSVFLILLHGWSIALAKPAADIQISYQDSAIVLTNNSTKAINLRHADIQFAYFGKIFKATNVDNAEQTVKLSMDEMQGSRVYTAKIYGTKDVMLLPNKSLKLALVTDKKDAPHSFKVKVAPTPVNVQISVSNANWVETISVCNTTNANIPLKNIELDFNYAVTMPANIWGAPWAAWKVASQTGTQVVLIGGTQFTPDLTPDPGCMHPLTIQFNAPPTNPAPTGPFVFKAEVGGNPGTTGNLNVMLSPTPAAGLANPTLTVTGPSTQQNVVTWGTTWALTNLQAGTYNITGSTVTAGGQTYKTDPVTATVTAGGTANATVTYKLDTVPTTAVTVTLVNPPTAQVPVTLVGNGNTINQTVSNGTVLNLASGTYNVSSNVTGYNAVVTPNPIVVPTNKSFSIAYTPVTPSGNGSRTINFVNQCPFPVWFGFVSGATPNKTGGEPCGSDADCHPGSVCVNRGAGGTHCFWKNPAPTNNNFQLTANGGTNSVVIPYVNVPMNAVWSGLAIGRTNCTAAGCETADCGGGTGACPSGKGSEPPATLAEFTFNTKIKDFYDVTAVDGLNIPVSMGPINGPRDPNDPYNCATPGSITAQPMFGVCSWDFVPPLPEYNWVRAGGNACTANADCTGGTVCGLSFNPGSTPYLKKTCGKRLGWLNANRVCGIDKNYGAPFNCQEKLPAPQVGNMINLYGCAPIDSCYKDGAPNTCCGCANWDKLGIPVPPGPYTKQCNNSNPTWTGKVLPGLDWLKKGCPSMYTYPFDDMSSTFVCQIMKDNNGTQVNSVDYTITFCPGGKTGGVVGTA